MVLLKKKMASREDERAANPPTPIETNSSGRQPSSSSSSVDKKGVAGHEAQRLASESSWADTYAPRTPDSILTPSASTDLNVVPADPPPMYTPTDNGSVIQPLYAQGSVIGSPSDSVGPYHPRVHISPSSPLLPEVVPTQLPHEEEITSPWSQHPDRVTLVSRWKRWRQRRYDARQKKKIAAKKFAVALWFVLAVLICFFMLKQGLFRGQHAALPASPPTITPAWPLPQREYRQEETSHAITGTFSLYDLLDLKTTSGSISITLKPCAGTKPAEIRLTTQSGSINIKLDSSFLNTPEGANRTFYTSISTTSGSVSGTIMHGNGGYTKVETYSGSIRLDVRPITIYGVSESSVLQTTANSGSQYIKVLGSKKGQHDLALNKIQATHIENGSGSMRISYPSEWQGQAHLKVEGSGHVTAKGDGLEMQQNGRKELYAWRGLSQVSKIDMTGSGSGSIAFSA